MGSIHSKEDVVNVSEAHPLSSSTSPTVSQEKKRLRQSATALKDYGVLIPPSFGLTGTPSQKGTGPGMSIQHRILQSSSHSGPVSYMQYLQQTDLSSCILYDHMIPMLALAAQASDSTMVRVGIVPTAPLVSTGQKQPSVSSGTLPTVNHLFIEKKLLGRNNTATTSHRGGAAIQLKAYDNSNAQNACSDSGPSLSASWSVLPTTTLFASMDTNGHGWLGGHWDRTFPIPSSFLEDDPDRDRTTATNNSSSSRSNDVVEASAADHDGSRPYEGLDTMCRGTINGKLGAWIPIDWNTGTKRKSLTKASSSSPYHLLTLSQQRCAYGYAAVNLLGATAAIDVRLPLDMASSSPSSTTYFSMNLNDTDRPPLQLTLQRIDSNLSDGSNTTTTSSIALSQVIAFDRLQWNPLESRAPYVRNTIAWTVRMDATPATTTNNDSSREKDNNNNNNQQHRLGMAVAWQINRNVAVKAALHPQEQQVTAALLLKRWQHPRVTCSLLYSLRAGGTTSTTRGKFLGVGIELETGSMETNPDAYYYNHHPSRSTVFVPNHSDVPPTRAVLPNETSYSA